MIIDKMQVTDTSLEEPIRQSLQEQMTRVSLSPAIRERIWRRIMAWAACDGEEDAEAEILPVDFCLEGSRLV
jgi:chorismate mutase